MKISEEDYFNTHCASCGLLQLDTEYFIMCAECFHIYKTSQDLLNMHNKMLKEIDENYETETDVNKIYSCPCCIHDF